MSHLLNDHPDWPNAMTTPTPRTDAAAVNAHDGLPVKRVSADFARQLERDLAARDAELTEANRLVAFWQQSSAEWKASRERLDAELARVREELASVNRAYAAVMQAVDECGSYKP